MVSCQVDIVESDDQAVFGFRLVSQPSGKEYIFMARGAQELDEWIETIRSIKYSAESQQQQQMDTTRRSQYAPQQQQQQQMFMQQLQADTQQQHTLFTLPNNTTLQGQNIQGPPMPSMQGAYANPALKAANFPMSPPPTGALGVPGAPGGGGGNTENTLVAGAKKAGQAQISVLIMSPDNKKSPPIEVEVTNIIKIGRYVNSNSPSQKDGFIAFKSKVISRNHAEVWAVNGEVYIRDTGSQSGTFLNAMRLSEPGKESRPYRLHTNDTVQFGVDYKNAEDDNNRCVSVKIEIKTKSEGGEGLVANAANTTLVAPSSNNNNNNIPAASTATSANTLISAPSAPPQLPPLQKTPPNYIAAPGLLKSIPIPNQPGIVYSTSTSNAAGAATITYAGSNPVAFQ